MALPTKTKALVYRSFGNAEEALEIEELTLPALGPRDVLAEMIAAPINPADFGRINGTYGDIADLPATAGNEGIARIIAIGNDVTEFTEGNLVFIPQEVGSWREYFVASANTLFRAPEKLPIETAAMAWVNPPTAWKLLHDFTQLQAGDWIIQNAATSAVGKLVIKFAHHLGFHTLNLVRDLKSEKRLKELGADIVVLDDRNAFKALEQTEGKKARLALNSVGGSSALNMAKCLEDGSYLVTFGGMDREPAPFPTRYLIFNDIRLCGFWVSRWYKEADRSEIEETFKNLFTFMEFTKTEIDVGSRFSLENYKKALAESLVPGKPGKTLFIR